MTKDEANAIHEWDKQAPSVELLTQISNLAPSIFWGGNYLGLGRSVRTLVWDKAQDGLHFAEHEIAWTNFDRGVSRTCRCALKSQEIFGVNSEREHPTQKPIRLMLWCIEWSKTTGTILDPFMGSGTTLVAAKKLDRKCIGIEINESYCEIAAKRLQNTTPSLFREEA